MGINNLSHYFKSTTEPAALPSAEMARPSSPACLAKKGKGAAQGSHTHKCQVEGCQADLSEGKTYYSKHKVCGIHSKSPMVLVGGLEQRFCQQCSRFHPLTEFDQGKRSCRRRLAGHNERRRKLPPSSLLSARDGKIVSAVHDIDAFMAENANGAENFLDFSQSRSGSRDAWRTLRIGGQLSANKAMPARKCLPNPQHGILEGNPRNTVTQIPHPYLQDLCGQSGLCSLEMSAGVCVPELWDSRCALSLLSNQHRESRDGSVEMNTSLSEHTTCVLDPSARIVPSCFTNAFWNFKTDRAGSMSLGHDVLVQGDSVQVLEATNNYFVSQYHLAYPSRLQCTNDWQ